MSPLVGDRHAGGRTEGAIRAADHIRPRLNPQWEELPAGYGPIEPLRALPDRTLRLAALVPSPGLHNSDDRFEASNLADQMPGSGR